MRKMSQHELEENVIVGENFCAASKSKMILHVIRFPGFAHNFEQSYPNTLGSCWSFGLKVLN